MKRKSEPLMVAIVGCGWAGGWHAADLRLLPEKFTLVACCDVLEARAQEFGARYQIPVRLTDYDALCAMSEVDVVVICTPPSMHHEMTLQALAANKHVVCEKPFVSSLAQVDSIREAESRSAGRIMPVFQYRFGAGIAKVRHLICSGVTGKHYVSAVETARWRGPDYYREAWRGKFATELGGVLVTQAIHIHDLLCWLIGPIAAVAAFKTTRVNPIQVEDCAVASLQMADGSLASLTATLGSVRQVTRIRICFEHVTFQRVCEHDQADRPGDEPWEILPRDDKIAAVIAAKLKDFSAGKPWFAGQYEQFYEAVTTETPFAVTIEDARASIELITALFEASETGMVVQLPIGPAHSK
jgi:predicted dehydrogenase